MTFRAGSARKILMPRSLINGMKHGEVEEATKNSRLSFDSELTETKQVSMFLFSIRQECVSALKKCGVGAMAPLAHPLFRRLCRGYVSTVSISPGMIRHPIVYYYSFFSYHQSNS